MNFGEQAGIQNRGEAMLSPDVLQENPDMLRESEALKPAEEQVQTVDPALLGNAAMNAAEYGVQQPAELGVVTDESALRPEIVLSTETGTIKDEDGVQEDIKNEAEAIQKEDDLGERAVKARMLNIKFLRGRYANRAGYMGGAEAA